MVNYQIETFKKGIPFTNLVSVATIGEGILKLDGNQEKEYSLLFESNS